MHRGASGSTKLHVDVHDLSRDESIALLTRHHVGRLPAAVDLLRSAIIRC